MNKLKYKQLYLETKNKLAEATTKIDIARTYIGTLEEIAFERGERVNDQLYHMSKTPLFEYTISWLDYVSLSVFFRHYLRYTELQTETNTWVLPESMMYKGVPVYYAK